jgi:hypothetical protein
LNYLSCHNIRIGYNYNFPSLTSSNAQKFYVYYTIDFYSSLGFINI